MKAARYSPTVASMRITSLRTPKGRSTLIIAWERPEVKKGRCYYGKY